MAKGDEMQWRFHGARGLQGSGRVFVGRCHGARSIIAFILPKPAVGAFLARKTLCASTAMSTLYVLQASTEPKGGEAIAENNDAGMSTCTRELGG